jgi:hypothetical protein
MEIRLARLEAIIPSLATREDLACLETRLNASINRVESTLHSELTKQTWRIVALLAGLLPSLFCRGSLCHQIRQLI